MTRRVPKVEPSRELLVGEKKRLTAGKMISENGTVVTASTTVATDTLQRIIVRRGFSDFAKAKMGGTTVKRP